MLLNIVTFTASKYHKIFLSEKAVVEQKNVMSYHCLGRQLPAFLQNIAHPTNGCIMCRNMSIFQGSLCQIFVVSDEQFCVQFIGKLNYCCVLKNHSVRWGNMRS